MAASRRKVRYAVVGLGHIAQAAVLPAFASATRNCELAALVSRDQTKLDELGDLHGVEHRFRDYDECLASGQVDAIYIALPNHQHCEYTVRAAEAGIHVLCEKPMAVTAAECEKMIHATDSAGVQLMIAYRLHFERANLKAIEIARSGVLGEVRAFHSAFAIDVQPGNVRLEHELGGGTLYDIGIYCINAARYLFGAEPVEVCALSATGDDPRFAEIDEMTGAVLRFPGERLAVILASFGAKEVGWYQLVGTQGNLRVDPAYDYASKLTHYLTIDGQTKKQAFSLRDQFAPELTYFADCILRQRTPEPDGREGAIDVKIVEAIYRSAKDRRPVQLDLPPKSERPSPRQERKAAPKREPSLVHATPPQEA